MRMPYVFLLLVGLSLSLPTYTHASFFDVQALLKQNPCGKTPGEVRDDWKSLSPIAAAQTIQESFALCDRWEKTCVRVISISEACWDASIDELLRLANEQCDTVTPANGQAGYRAQNKKTAREARADLVDRISAENDCNEARSHGCTQQSEALIGLGVPSEG